MRKVLIERFETTDEGTFGRCFVDGIFFSYSLELPWRDNDTNFSCIPAGEYDCAWTYSPRFRRKMYLVKQVPDRTGIRFHSANLAGDREQGLRCQLNGCIALGEMLGSIDGQRAVLKSAPTIRRFEFLLSEKPFLLEVKYAVS